ncbi:MAG: hypothetical protein ACK4NR_01975 [Micavibrio sp.]
MIEKNKVQKGTAQEFLKEKFQKEKEGGLLPPLPYIHASIRRLEVNL